MTEPGLAARQVVAPYSAPVLPEPWRQTLNLGGRTASRLVLGFAGAILFHGALADRGHLLNHALLLRAYAASVQRSVHERVRIALEVEVEQARVPDEPTEPVETPETQVQPPPKVREALPPKEEPPAAAQAGKLLTAAPDPEEPIDLTGDVGFVTGNNETYAGGVTAARGTSKTAVYDRTATEDGQGTRPASTGSPPAKAPPAIDRSRRATLVGNTDWSSECRLPRGADELEDENLRPQVSLSVTVDVDGKPTRATVLRDPGYGFGEAARRCVLRKDFLPTLDKSGKPVLGTWLGNVTFTLDR